MPGSETIALVNDLVRLGLMGWLVLTILALIFRWVYTRGTVNDIKTSHAKEIARLELVHQRELAIRDVELTKWEKLYERERADRLEAQREVPETVEVLKLSIRVFDQLNQPKAKGR